MTKHPTKDELSAFLLGKLPQDKCEDVSRHIEICPPCQETVSNLESESDTLLEQLRRSRLAETDVSIPDPSVSRRPDPSESDDASVTQSASSEAGSDTPVSLRSSASAQYTLKSVFADTQIPTSSEILSAIKAANLLSTYDWKEVSPELIETADGRVLVNTLLELRKITEFQAKLILQGKVSFLSFGEYLVFDQIGTGGMGHVFKARHRRMDRVVAIKVMDSTALKSAEAVKRFQREVKAAAKLVHPNIVTAYDAGEHEDRSFLVMEFVDGCDLSNYIKDHGPMSIREVMDVLLQSARGLAFAHAEGIVHRDIKPANILRDNKGVVRILDLGLARFDDPLGRKQGDEITDSGQVMGTVDYMAPEQAFDTRDAGPAADVYSLGCTMYRLLTGQPLYEGATVVQKILAHRERPIPALHDLCPDVSPALENLFARMVAKRIEDRPTMVEIVQELQSLDPMKVVQPATAISRRDAATEMLMIAASDAGRGKRPVVKWLGTVVAAFLIVACAAWVVIRDRDGHEVGRFKLPDGGSDIVQNDVMQTTSMSSLVSPSERVKSSTATVGVPVKPQVFGPLTDLPKAFALPPHTAGEKSTPVSLGKLELKADETLKLQLLTEIDGVKARRAPSAGAAALGIAVKKEYRLEMSAPNGKQRWIVVAKVLNQGSDKPDPDQRVGEFFVDSGKLQFQWDDKIEEVVADQLRSAVLKSQVGTFELATALRGVIQQSSITVDLTRKITHVKLPEAKGLPPKEAMWIEVLSTEAFPDAVTFDPTEKRVQGRKLKVILSPSKPVVRLDVDVNISSSGATLRFEPIFEVLDGRAEDFTKERIDRFNTIEKVIEDNEELLKVLDRNLVSLQSELASELASVRVSDPTDLNAVQAANAKRGRLQSSITSTRTKRRNVQSMLDQLGAIRTALPTLQKMATVHQRGELSYRIFYIVEGHEVDVVRAVASVSNKPGKVPATVVAPESILPPVENSPPASQSLPVENSSLVAKSPQDPWQIAKAFMPLKESVFLVVVEEPESGAMWGIANATALSETHLLTNGVIAIELAKFEKKGWKIYLMQKSLSERTAVATILVQAGAHIEQPDEQIYFDYGLLVADQPLSCKPAKLASPGEISAVERGVSFASFAIDYGKYPLDRFQRIEPQLLSNKVVTVTRLNDEAGAPQLARVSGEFVNKPVGCPIFNEKGHIVGIYSDIEKSDPNSVQSQIHYMPIITPGMDEFGFQGQANQVWVAPFDPNEPPPKLK